MSSPTFNILVHIDKLSPVDERNKKGYYYCPACGDDNFGLSAKTGAYQCFGNGCKPKDIRNAIAPFEKQDQFELPQLQRIAYAKANKELVVNTAQVEAKAEELALLVAEKIYSPEQAALTLSEWCRQERRDRFTANKILEGFLNQLAPQDEGLDTDDDAQALEKMVLAYANEERLSRKLVLRKRLRSRFSVNQGDVEGLTEVLAASAGLDFIHGSEAPEGSMDFLERLELLQSGKLAPGLMTGFASLDRYLQGLGKKSLTIIGGRPAQVNSAVVLSIFRNVQRLLRFPVAMFNLEMTSDQWRERWISAERSISYGKIRSGHINEQEWAQVLDCMAHFYELPIYLSEASGITPSYLRRSCSAIAEKAGSDLGLIVVDYLNLMRAPGASSRVQEVSQIARDLQSLGKEMNAPVIALSQLSRGASHRSTKEPVLEDLRESGEIEQVADVVMLVHRPGKYDESIPDAVGKIITAKNRHGPTGTCEVLFEGEYMRFRDGAGRIN